MRFVGGNQDVEVTSVADVQAYWSVLRQRQFAEVWLDAGEEGPALCVLVNGERAWLLYLRDHQGDAGLSSRDPEYSGPTKAVAPFALDNGQIDEYPVAWTLPLEQAIAACEYFAATQGLRSPNVVWHDDALDRES